MDAAALPEVSVVLPAYEEAANLATLLPALQRVLQNSGMTSEIVVIGVRNPSDDTPEVCARHHAIYRARNGGELYGHAVRTAQQTVCGRYVILMDADGSHDPEFVPRLCEQRGAADLVIASRYTAGGRTDNPAILVFLSLVVNVVFRVTLGLPCADVSNSFRLYRGDDFRALVLECNHFDIVEEMLVKLFFGRPGFMVKEVPFVFEQRKAGKTKRKLLVFALGYVATLLRLYRLKRRTVTGK